MAEAFELLSAISEAVDELHHHGYALYLRTKAASWTNRRSITVSGKPFRLLFGNAILPTKDRALIFGIEVSWNSDDWKIEANIETERYEPSDLPSQWLWAQTYSGTGVASFREVLTQSIQDLKAQTASDWFDQHVRNAE